MLRGLTQVGLGKIESTERFIELASEYGFQAVDIDPKDLLDRMGKEEAKAFLQKHKMKIGAILMPVQWRTTEEEFKSDLAKLAEYAESASFLGCSSFWTYILPSVDANPAHLMAIATRRLRVCAQVLEVYGIRLGMEFIGSHDLRTQWKNPFIWTMHETLDWVAAIDRPHVGLVLDSFHWHTAGHTVEDIEKLRPEQIVHVHISDAPHVPIERLPDDDRLYPGEGAIDLAGFLCGLKQIGYQGVIAQEVLSPSAPTESVETLLERSKKAFNKVFTAAGLL